MARTDDDTWDITEGVGATALGVAWARSQEATAECPLFTDPYAEVFVEEALGARLAAAADAHDRADPVDFRHTPRRAPNGSTSSSSPRAQAASTRR